MLINLPASTIHADIQLFANKAGLKNAALRVAVEPNFNLYKRFIRTNLELVTC